MQTQSRCATSLLRRFAPASLIVELWEWTAAAQAAAKRGEALVIARVMVPAYVVTLQDGTAMPYRDHDEARAFRDIDQATTAILNQRLPLTFIVR